MTEKELQEKVLTYRVLESRLDGLIKQRDILGHKLIELETTLKSIDEIDNSKEEILFPIGSEAYTFGKVINKDKIIVEIGAGVALEKSIEDGKNILNERKGDLEKTLDIIEKHIKDVSYNLEQLAPEIQEMIEASKETSAG